MPDMAVGSRRFQEGVPRERVTPWDAPAPLPRRPRWHLILRLVLGAVVLGLLVVLVRGMAFVAAVSTEPFAAATFWPATDQRQANVLVLGYGGQGHEGSLLTDSFVLLSADLTTRRTAQISVPRDLWVQVPPDSGRYAKLNTAYDFGYHAGGVSPVAGGQMATRKVEQVTGLPVDRWVTIDFRGFRALVDALGGVEIEVERAFSADYPANDDPDIDASWTTVHFAAGQQWMDGEAALRYARARYADVPEEASDFARARRQQRLVGAMGARLASPTAWWRVFGVLDALQPALRTNLAPFDLLVLTLRADPGGSMRIVLDDENVLEHGESDDGQAILLPRGGDYGVIPRYIRERLGAHEHGQ
jgi:LCP family protein required for cell wall assembly